MRHTNLRLRLVPSFVTAAALTAAVLVMGCEKSETERVENAARDASDAVKDAAGKAADATADAAKKAADATADAAKKADQKVGELTGN